jgi:hypothetical protein
MARDFSTAPTQQGGELIPAKTLAWGSLNVKAKALDFGKVLAEGRDNPGNKWIDVSVELESAHVHGRKVFDKIAVEGSEKWVNMGMAAVRHILEVGRRIGQDGADPAGYTIGANMADDDERQWMELDGLKVAVEIGIEKGKGDYPDKNNISAYLSPNPDSPTHKKFAMLLAGATSSEGAAKTGSNPAAAFGAVNSGYSHAAPSGVSKSAGAPVAARPGWTGDPPPANAPPVAIATRTGGAPW